MQLDLRGIWSFQTGKKISNNKWEEVMLPKPWQNQGHRRYDGYAWYSRTFNLPEHLYGKDLVFVGGKIDDFDVVYINGQKIGETNDHRPFGASGSYSVLRVYTIPSNVLWRGENTITIMVEDIGNIGGMYEGPVGITTRELYERHFSRR
jgi:sialate O-acetylesterase